MKKEQVYVMEQGGAGRQGERGNSKMHFVHSSVVLFRLVAIQSDLMHAYSKSFIYIQWSYFK